MILSYLSRYISTFYVSIKILESAFGHNGHLTSYDYSYKIERVDSPSTYTSLNDNRTTFAGACISVYSLFITIIVMSSL